MVARPEVKVARQDRFAREFEAKRNESEVVQVNANAKIRGNHYQKSN